MKILIADDDSTTRRGIEAFLNAEGHTVTAVADGRETLNAIQREGFDLLLLDVRMPALDGLAVLKEIRNRKLPLPCLIMTAYATVEDAVTAMRIGADDYLTKPLNLEELGIRIGRLRDTSALRAENQELRRRLLERDNPTLVGESRTMTDAKRMIARVAADPDVSLIIYGESGTGKELAARSVHAQGSRSSHPFVAVNCAALPDTLLESELFGYERGAFTGAFRSKIGLFQASQGGTLLLDEVGEMSSPMQAKLLRVLQEREVQPLGSTAPVPFDARVIGASRADLNALMRAGKFRDDLFYRLNVVEIHLPPLRERPEDVPALVDHFLQERERKDGRRIRFNAEALEALGQYGWPGNVRELQNVVSTLFVTAEAETVRLADLPLRLLDTRAATPGISPPPWISSPFTEALREMVRQFEREYLLYHINRNNGNLTKTSEAIRLSRVTLHKKIRDLGLEPARPKKS
jgi:DNA-binding NtrC family response regulator